MSRCAIEISSRLAFRGRICSEHVPDARVLELARRLGAGGFHDLSDRLEDAWRREIKVFGLGVEDRESILRVLKAGPAEFAELRGVLLEEHVWRVREGL